MRGENVSSVKCQVAIIKNLTFVMVILAKRGCVATLASESVGCGCYQTAWMHSSFGGCGGCISTRGMLQFVECGVVKDVRHVHQAKVAIPGCAGLDWTGLDWTGD